MANIMHLLSLCVIVIHSAMVLSVMTEIGEDQPSRPDGCHCILGDGNTSLQIMCNPSVEHSELEKQINNVIQAYPQLISLSILSTAMENIDKIFLSTLKNLKHLTFINNTRIKSIPHGFLSGLSELENLLWIRSSITFLQEDMFKGLDKLSSIELYENQLTTIHPKTFLDLPGVRYISLSDNNLTTLDIWPLYISVNIKEETTINLDRNRIKAFTNSVKWIYRCDMNPGNGRIDMDFNQVNHFIDFTNGYNLIEDMQILCLFRSQNFHVGLLDNPLVCDCVDFKFYRFFFQTHKTQTINNLMCASGPLPGWAQTKLVSHHLIEFVCDIHGNCPEGCTCYQRPANISLHINCQGRDIKSLPDRLPVYTNMTDYKYLLQFENNDLSSLDYRNYMENLYTADFSGNQLLTVDTVAVEVLANSSKYIYLDNNQLTRLPEDIQTVNFSKVIEISLHSNPWNCDCDAKWMIPWLRLIKNKLSSPNSVLCETPVWIHKKNIFALTENDFCVDPRQQQLNEIIGYTLAGVLATLILFVIPFIIVYRKRIWIYRRFHFFHPFDRDEQIGEGKLYDAVILYSQEEREWVSTLRIDLESMGFKICFDDRDFPVNEPEIKSASESFITSKRYICVISSAFVNSNMTMWGFYELYSAAVETKKSRLILIKYEDVDHNSIHPSLASLLRHGLCINHNCGSFMDELAYYLPIHGLGHDPLDLPESTSDQTPLNIN